MRVQFLGWEDPLEKEMVTCSSILAWDIPIRESIPHLQLQGGNGAPLEVGETLVLPLEWRRVCRGTS